MCVNSHAFSLLRHKHSRHWNRGLTATDILSLDSWTFFNSWTSLPLFYFFYWLVNHHIPCQSLPWLISNRLRGTPQGGGLIQQSRHNEQTLWSNTQSIRIIKAYFTFVCKSLLKCIIFFSLFFSFPQCGIYCNWLTAGRGCGVERGVVRVKESAVDLHTWRGRGTWPR